MSLTFTNATTDKVTIAAATSINALQQITILTWLYPTGFASNQFILAKRTDVNAGWGHRINDSSGNVYVNKPTGSAGSSAITNNAPLTVNAWNFIAATGSNDVSSNNCAIYTGNLTTLAAEATYGTRVDRAAASAFDDSGWPLYIGGRNSASQSFAGRIGVQALFNRVLSLEEIQSWQFNPRMLPGCVGLWLLGDNGTGTQPDYSGNGNSGTVTGATQSDNPPLRRRFGRRLLDALYATAAPPAGGGSPYYLHYYNRLVNGVVD